MDEHNWLMAESVEELFMDIGNQVQLDTIPNVADILNGYKNSSLYADFNNDIFYKPNEKIDKKSCIFMIVLAQIQRKYFDYP
ncbi:AbiV family abortive infection protein [Neobacillus niacini]|uniref:AbiV family abortive infection protein n=1 Tax=Neobacillus niacini TaxID=86668 RepID=UPI0005EEB7D6